MQTRRDQLHAYRFMTRRAMSALVTGEPDSVDPPMRRLTLITISGIMVAIVVAAVFAVIGLLKGGGGDDWMAEGSIVVEEETGAQFVMIDGTLHPTLNYASAVLATGSSNYVKPQIVSRSDLGGADRGATIGIPELPDSMPSRDELVKGPVTVCSQARTEDGGIDVRAIVDVEIGTRTPSRMLAPGEALYVDSFEGKRFLLFDGRRHQVDESVEAALQINQEPVRVGSAFLTSVPVGAPFETPHIEGQGNPASLPGQSMQVGQVIEVDDGTYRVVLPDGVAPVSDVQAKLLRTMKLDGQRRDPVAMTLTESLDMPPADGLGEVMADLPAQMPSLSSAAAGAGGACTVFTEGETVPKLAVPDGDAAGSATTESDDSLHGSADNVTLEPGKGLLAAVKDGGTVYVVAEPGSAYAAKNLATLGGFGYGDVKPVRVPAELLDILPAGGALDPGDARMSVTP